MNDRGRIKEAMTAAFSTLRAPILSATRFYQQLRSSDEGVDVTNADWDSLVVLDGCRYDMFERLSTLPGTLEDRLSRGSATDEFVKSNFGSGTFKDIVYVTANPRVNLAFSGQFHDIVNVWEDGWDDELNTVPPKTVADETIRVLEEYPHKRIVSHFIQPHAPFIGEFARKNLVRHSTLGDHRPDGGDGSESSESIWALLRRGEVDVKAVKRAYDENLEIAIPHVERIMNAESGKCVVTSDHGNLLGERISPFKRRFYGHPSRFHAENLLRVPWLEEDTGERRNIVAEDAKTNDVELGDDVEQKLEDLGYVQK